MTRGNGTQYRIYACNGEAAMGACPSRATVVSGVVEPHVDAVFFGLLWAADIYASTHPRLQKHAASLARARAETARYRDSTRALRTLGAERFAQGLGKRVAREQRLRLTLDGERARLGIATRTDAEQLEASWASISVPERRQRMSDTIDAIFVLREPDCRGNRIFVCARGEAPCDRQRRGRIGKPTLPVALAALRQSSHVDLAQANPWSRAG